MIHFFFDGNYIFAASLLSLFLLLRVFSQHHADWPVFRRGALQIQISWHLFGWTQQAAYASQVTCTPTCHLQIINVVLISHINSCHFVGMVSPRRSLGLVPAVSASESAREIFLLQSQSGVSQERRVAGCCAYGVVHAHVATHSKHGTDGSKNTFIHMLWVICIYAHNNEYSFPLMVKCAHPRTKPTITICAETFVLFFPALRNFWQFPLKITKWWQIIGKTNSEHVRMRTIYQTAVEKQQTKHFFMLLANM